MSDNRHLYFAYGSNMDPVQMAQRCPEASPQGVAVLAAHRLEFTRHSQTRECGVADVVAVSGYEVWGVVFSLTDSDLVRLDKSEGYKRVSDTGAYLWRSKRVVLQSTQAQEIEVHTYVVSVPQTPRPLPSRAYLGQIIDGARHWNLPTPYVEALNLIPTKD